MRVYFNDSSIRAVLVAALFYALLWAFHIPGNILSWDVFGYYLYLPFSFIYCDLGLENIHQLQEIVATYNNSDTLYQLVPYDGKNLIKYPVGWALLNLPFFIMGHVAALLTDYPTDGFSKPYQICIFLGNAFYVFLGFEGVRRLLRNWFSPLTTAITFLLIVIGTNFLHQAIQAPGMVHTYLFSLYAWVGVLVFRDKKNGQPSLLLGMLTGLLLITRNSEVVFLVFLLLMFGFRKDRQVSWFTGVFKYWKAFGLGAVIALTPQIGYWFYVTGLPVVYSYNNPGEGFDLLGPHTLDFLFSFRKGWLVYTPLMVFAVLGIRSFSKVDRQWSLSVFWMLIFTVYLLSAWTTWWYAASFGQRSMVQSYALLALPLAGVIQSVLKQKRVEVLILFAVLTGWNLFQTYQYEKGIIDPTRMTKEAYFAHMFRVEPLDEKGKRLLLVNRSTDGVDFIPENPILRKTWIQSFESDSAIARDDWKGVIKKLINRNQPRKEAGISQEVAFTGDYSFATSAVHPYSPAIRLPFNTLTSNHYTRILADVSLKTKSTSPVPVSLVVTFEHNGKAYKYRTKDIALVSDSGWVSTEMWYLTPEIRNESDELAVYVWNRGTDSVWVDDLRVRVYDDSLDSRED